MHFLTCNAVFSRAERSRAISWSAVQRLSRKRHIRRRASRDRRQEREQERLRPMVGSGQVTAVTVAWSRLRQRHDRFRHSSNSSQSTAQSCPWFR